MVSFTLNENYIVFQRAGQLKKRENWESEKTENQRGSINALTGSSRYPE